LAVTLSAGVAVLDTQTGDLGTLLEAADAALYQAKAEGRNRVAVASAA
jgi:two-component system cell cycle response regulator